MIGVGVSLFEVAARGSAALPPPWISVAPVISGNALVGQTLSCTTGTWGNAPSSYAYQWKADGTNISGATSSTYALQSAEAGKAITCAVTATNAGGASSPATSNALYLVPASPAFHFHYGLGMEQTSGGSAANDNDPVGRWLDQSGNGNHAAQTTSGNRPIADAAYGANTNLAYVTPQAWTNASQALSRNAVSVFAVVDGFNLRNGGSPAQYRIIWSSPSNFSLFVNSSTGKIGYRDSGGTLTDTTLVCPTGRALVGAISSAGSLKIIVNNQSVDVTALSANAMTGWNLCAGASLAFPWLGRIRAIVAYASAVDSTALAQIRAWAQQEGAIFDAPNVVVYEGDSISSMARAARNRGWNQTLQLGATAVEYNLATPGISMASIASQNLAGSFYNSGKRCVLVVFAGTNDLTAGTTGASCHTSLSSYCAAKRSQGYKVVVVTMLPAASVETQRQAYNNAIRANWASYADALADVETVAAIGAANANNDTTYYDVDALHPNAAGHALLNSLIKPLMVGLMV